MKSTVNFIRHLLDFFIRSDSDADMRPNHISLYLALFRWWNERRFQNPFRINRKRLMLASKISTNLCYKKCMNELEEWGYVKYHEPERAGDSAMVEIIALPCSVDRSHFSGEEAKCSLKEVKQFSPIPTLKTVHINKQEKEEEKEIEMQIPSLAEVSAYFSSKNYEEDEGKKFFSHYQAINWLQSGKIPIANWQASADKWMLNASKSKKESSDSSSKKNYATPL